MGKSKVTRAVGHAATKNEVAVFSGPTRLVDFLEGGGRKTHIDQSQVPALFRGHKMQTGSFKPVADWDKPGDCIAGTFQRVRTEVGPNNSRIYELNVDIPELLGGRKPFEAAFWGSTQLDDLFDTHEPPVTEGDRVLIIYTGTSPTKRGLNPVKLFTLTVIPAGTGKRR